MFSCVPEDFVEATLHRVIEFTGMELRSQRLYEIGADTTFLKVFQDQHMKRVQANLRRIHRNARVSPWNSVPNTTRDVPGRYIAVDIVIGIGVLAVWLVTSRPFGWRHCHRVVCRATEVLPESQVLKELNTNGMG